MLEISLLQKEDLKECHDLCELCFQDHINYRQIESVYNKCQGSSMYKWIVAKLDNKIVGYTSMIIFYNLFDGNRPLATLWFVCVHPDYRRKGIATSLFKKIESIATEENCELIYFTSEISNSSAHEFYKKIGYNLNLEKAFYKYFD